MQNENESKFNLNDIEGNVSISGRCNSIDKEYFNEQKNKEGLNYAQFLHKVLEVYKTNSITEEDLSVVKDLKEVSVLTAAIENIIRTVASKSQTYVLANKKSTELKITENQERVDSIIAEYKQKEEDYINKNNELVTENNDLSKQMKELNKELCSKDKSVLELDAKIKDLEIDITTVKEEKLNLLSEVKDKNVTIEQLRENEKEYIASKKLNENKIKELDDKFVKLDREYNKILDKNESLKLKLDESVSDIKKLKTSLANKDKELVELEKSKYKEIDEVKAEIRKEYEESVKALHEKIYSLEAEVKVLKKDTKKTK